MYRSYYKTFSGNKRTIGFFPTEDEARWACSDLARAALLYDRANPPGSFPFRAGYEKTGVRT